MEKRIYAHLIDLLALSVIATVASLFISLDLGTINTFTVEGREITADYSLYILVVLVYYFLFDLFNQGRTLGKMLLKLHITTKDNNPSGVMRLLCRSVLKSLLLFTVLFVFVLVYYLMAKTVLYDRMLKTQVVSD